MRSVPRLSRMMSPKEGQYMKEWWEFEWQKNVYTIFGSSVQSFTHVQLFATPWTATFQASRSITISWSLLKLMYIESVMPSNHLILCRPLLLLPSLFLSIGVFSNESVLHIRWPKYWSFSFSICPSNEYSGLISFRIDWFHLLTDQGDLIHYIIIHYKYILKYSLCIYSVQFERLLNV